jgi:hypothetical protein
MQFLRKAVRVLKVKVIKQYSDKYTKEMVYPSDELREVTDERGAELIEAGVAVAFEELAKKAAAKKAK